MTTALSHCDNMTYEVVQDRRDATTWAAEAINHASEGEVYRAVFTGPNSQQRAQEYAAWKNEPVRRREIDR